MSFSSRASLALLLCCVSSFAFAMEEGDRRPLPLASAASASSAQSSTPAEEGLSHQLGRPSITNVLYTDAIHSIAHHATLFDLVTMQQLNKRWYGAIKKSSPLRDIHNEAHVVLGIAVRRLIAEADKKMFSQQRADESHERTGIILAGYEKDALKKEEALAKVETLAWSRAFDRAETFNQEEEAILAWRRKAEQSPAVMMIATAEFLPAIGNKIFEAKIRANLLKIVEEKAVGGESVEDMGKNMLRVLACTAFYPSPTYQAHPAELCDSIEKSGLDELIFTLHEEALSSFDPIRKTKLYLVQTAFENPGMRAAIQRCYDCTFAAYAKIPNPPPLFDGPLASLAALAGKPFISRATPVRE